jgi:hypothetical protein
MDFMILAPDIDNLKLIFDLYLIKNNHPILIKLYRLKLKQFISIFYSQSINSQFNHLQKIIIKT